MYDVPGITLDLFFKMYRPDGSLRSVSRNSSRHNRYAGLRATIRERDPNFPLFIRSRYFHCLRSHPQFEGLFLALNLQP